MERLHPGVYIEEVPSGARPIGGVGTSTTAFIGWAPKGPVGKAELVTSFIEYQRKFGSFYVTSSGSIKSYLAHALLHYFLNGGSRAYVIRLAIGAATAKIVLQDRQATPADTLEVSAINPGEWGNELILEVGNGTNDPDNEFRLTVKRESAPGVFEILEVYDGLSMVPSASNFVESVVTVRSQLIQAIRVSIGDLSPADLRPALGTNFRIGTSTAGSDGNTPQNGDYTNSLNRLNAVRDFSLLVIPGIGSKDVIDGASTYCETRSQVNGVNDCFFIGEADGNTDEVGDAAQFVRTLTKKSPYAALYFPWLEMVDPTGKSPIPIKVPPSGFVAGQYAAIDGRRGVWKAPAGTEANIGGASGLTVVLADAEQDSLNNLGVNCLRSFPDAGIVIWGARTLSTLSQPQWRYIPVRRMAIFLEVSIYNGIQWAVFEPNDEDLWASLRLSIGSFMMRLFRQGAFQGATPSQAFFVKCDNDTTTQADIDAGTVNVLVGFAPLKPAEFVVVKISQIAGRAV